MIRIKNQTGMIKDTKVFHVNDQGHEFELKHINAIELDEMNPGAMFVSGKIGFTRISLDIVARLGILIDRLESDE